MLDKLKKMKPKKMSEQEAEVDLEELLGGASPKDLEGEDDMMAEEKGADMASAGKKMVEAGKDLMSFGDDELIQELELRGFSVDKGDKPAKKKEESDQDMSEDMAGEGSRY